MMNAMPDKVLNLFEETTIPLNEVGYLIVYNACAALSNERAKTLSKKLLKQMPTSFLKHDSLLTAALDMLMKFGDVSQAERLFKQLTRKSVVSYGALMQGKQEGMHVVLHLFVCIGYIKNEMPEKALALFETFPGQANEVLYTMVFSACAALNDANAKERGMKLLKQMPQSFRGGIVVTSAAMYMLMKFGEVKDAEHLLTYVKKPDVSLYGVMMTGYNMNDAPDKCLELFYRLQRENIPVNEVICLLAIGACSDIGLLPICLTVINQIPVHLLQSRYLQNAAIDMWVSVSSWNGCPMTSVRFH